MKPHRIFTIGLLGSIGFLASCNNSDNQKETEMKEPKYKEENVTYTGDSITMQGYVVYDENITGPRPAVLVVHEWWGLNEYSKKRARDLAGLGYIAMAIDLYGDGKQADSPDSAGKLATPFYMDVQKAKRRFDAGMEKLRTYTQADPARFGAIGYCFGGAQVLNMAKLGADLKGVVSFHGNLNVVTPQKDLLKGEVLVCHGSADDFVPPAELAQFRKQMDSVGAKYTIREYPGAVHAFTNPEATAKGEKFGINIKYDAAADTASWNDMRSFFERVLR